MFDPRHEQPIPLKDVPDLACVRAGGTPPHRATVSRWAGRGLRGHRLETIRVGGKRCTSEEALVRFFRRISDDTPAPPAVVDPPRTAKPTEAVLRRAGILRD